MSEQGRVGLRLERPRKELGLAISQREAMRALPSHGGGDKPCDCPAQRGRSCTGSDLTKQGSVLGAVELSVESES